MNAAAEAFSLPFAAQKEVGIGAKPQCATKSKAAHQKRKTKRQSRLKIL